MKVINYLLIISALFFLFACSSNKEVAPEIPQEVVKTPLEKAVEIATEGTEAYQNKDYEAALTKFNEAIEQFNLALPTAAVADSVPANIFRLKMNIAQTHNSNAFSLYMAKDYDTSILEYLASIDAFIILKPQSAVTDSIDAKITNLYLNTAISYREAGEYEKAIEYFDKYLQANPNDDIVIMQKYQIYSEYLKNEAMAIENLSAFADSKLDFNASFKLGDIYLEKKDYPKAIEWYEKARKIKLDVNVLKQLANVYKNPVMKQYAKSNEILEQLIKISKSDSPEKKQYLKMIGANYKDLGNRAKAVEYFDKYLELEYDTDLALYISLYYYELKNNNKSMAYANMILDRNPSHVNALLFRAIARFNLNDKKGAKADFERIQNDPKQGPTAQKYLKLLK